jgi:MHS family proline/betaine transporter-like MFS transporter
MKFRNVFSSFLGSIAEWYEFVVYGFCASFLGPLFFPADKHFISVLAAFGAFALGFLARPAGALIFGYIGDKYSRKKAMSFSIILIGLPTLVMGIIPTYQTIGIFAPIILLLARLLQGLSVGGQFTGAAIFITEHMRENQKNFGASIVVAGGLVGMLIASFTGAFLTHFLTHEQLARWGWRIPFIFGIFITILGFYIKSHTTEPEKFTQMKKQQQLLKNPIKTAFYTEKMPMLLSALACWLSATIIYQLFIFMPTYVHTYLQLPLAYTLRINTMTMIILAVLTCIFGFLADLWGYRKFIIIGSGFFVVMGLPMYYILATSPETLLYVQIAFAVFGAMFIGPILSVLTHAFVLRTRYTALSFSYNLGFGIFGGTNALVNIFLIEYLRFIAIPGIYISFAALVSLASFLCLLRYQKKIN